jgi:hypothetical protein
MKWKGGKKEKKRNEWVGKGVYEKETKIKGKIQ